MHPSKSRAIGIAVVLVVGVCVFTNLSCRSIRSDVAKVSNEFLRLWRSGDYTAAYVLMTDAYRSRHPFTEFTNGLISHFADTVHPDSNAWTVNPDINVELRGRNHALVSEFGTRFLGMRCVLGTCYELRKGPAGWRFTGEAESIQD